jgi:NAD(P)-dependent dehydrogenase (short-subunit alcohol dehydrogenase family)
VLCVCERETSSTTSYSGENHKNQLHKKHKEEEMITSITTTTSGAFAAARRRRRQQQQQQHSFSSSPKKRVYSSSSSSSSSSIAFASSSNIPDDDDDDGKKKSDVGVQNAKTRKKTCIITGANTGIGYETALAMLQKEYKVIAAVRDVKKMELARESLMEKLKGTEGVEIEIEAMDLSDKKSIEAFAKKFMDSDDALDVLINNAGVMATPEMKTKDNFEYQIGVNHLGHYKLTNMVLPKLLESGSASGDARIVNVSSEAHRFGKLEKNDLFYEKAGSYNNWKSYGQSKLANILFANELQRKLEREKDAKYVSCNALHPGAVNTELGRYLYDADKKPGFFEEMIFNVIRTTMKTPAQGAETSVYLASDPTASRFRGKYFDNCKEKVSTNAARNEDDARWLWQRSAELTGVDFF